MIEITGSNQEVAMAKDIAMHTAAAAPEYLSPEQVPQKLSIMSKILRAADAR